MSIAIILSDFHPTISAGLLKGAEDVLRMHRNVRWSVYRVPGSFEIPLMIQRLAKKKKHQVFLALGAIIKGQTKHFDLVATECARGCMDVSLRQNVPVVFEVLACMTEKQALARSKGKFNRGRLGAEVALWWLENNYQ